MDPREFKHAPGRTRFVANQEAFSVVISLSVIDRDALWHAAAARALEMPGMSMADVEDVLGPQQDPELGSCIAMLAAPNPIAGCSLESFDVTELPLGRALPSIAA